MSSEEGEELESAILASCPVRTVDLLEPRIRHSPTDAVAFLYGTVREVSACRGVDDLVNITAEQIFRAFPASTHLTIFLPPEGGSGPLEHAFMRQRRSLGEFRSEDHGVSRTLLDRVTSERVAVLFVDARAAFPGRESVRMSGIRSSILVPLFAPDRFGGVLQVDSRSEPNAFSESDLEILTIFGSHLAAILDNARLRDELGRKDAGSERRGSGERASAPPASHDRRTDFVCRSKVMRKLYAHVEQAARESLPVMLCGETGTGKDVVARLVHTLSGRSAGPYVPLNCGAVPKELLDSELFGHAKGAFTGAIAQRGGLFLNASGGTLFLDEVGDLPLDAQVKLLRVVEEGRVRAVGSDRFQPIDVRMICATNKDLDEEMTAGRFRADLFYRLNVLRVDLPPLRERSEDIPALAEHFLAGYCAAARKRIAGFSPKAIECLLAYPWPGNVRELRNETDRAAAMTRQGGTIGPESLSARVRGEANAEDPGAHGEEEGTLKEAVETVERRMIEMALSRFKNNISRVAKYLGLSRPGLRQKMERYGISKTSDE